MVDYPPKRSTMIGHDIETKHREKTLKKKRWKVTDENDFFFRLRTFELFSLLFTYSFLGSASFFFLFLQPFISLFSITVFIIYFLTLYDKRKKNCLVFIGTWKKENILIQDLAKNNNYKWLDKWYCLLSTRKEKEDFYGKVAESITSFSPKRKSP